MGGAPPHPRAQFEKRTTTVASLGTWGLGSADLPGRRQKDLLPGSSLVALTTGSMLTVGCWFSILFLVWEVF